MPVEAGLVFVRDAARAFLAAIGGLSGGKRTKSVEFEWQTVDRRSSTVNNTARQMCADVRSAFNEIGRAHV